MVLSVHSFGALFNRNNQENVATQAAPVFFNSVKTGLTPLKADAVQFSGKNLNDSMIADMLDFKIYLAQKFNLSDASELTKIGILRIGMDVVERQDSLFEQDDEKHAVAFSVLVKESEYNRLHPIIPARYKGYEVHVHPVLERNSPL